jgi:signal transduction histidine kinase
VSDLDARLQKLERILAVSQELASTVELKPLLAKIVATAAELTDCEGASILLLDERTGQLRFYTVASALSDQLAGMLVPIEGSIAGAVLRSGEPLIVPDVRKDERHYDEIGQRVGFETRSLLAVPLWIKERHTGVLEAVNKRQSQFAQDDVEVLMTLAAQAAVAIENARLVEALQEANARLGQLDHLKSNFIAVASHELRTPLSLILGYAASLRENLQDTAGEQLDVVLRAGMRLKHIIETMLNLRYLELGEMTLACNSFDLREVVWEACEAYRSLAEGSTLLLQAQLPKDPLMVWADRAKVRVVLDNLLSNAVKFTPRGGRVQIDIAKQEKQVAVSVTDTGLGIPSDALDHIFDRFRQAEDPLTRRHGGMGLGLSIAKGLVELHNGEMWVEKTAPGKGSRFVFTLPVEPPPALDT